MSTDQHKHHRTTHWPPQLAPIGGIRFARRSSHFAETVRFYRDLVGLPLYETFEDSYGSNGAIEPVDQHPYWAATGAITYRDPDGREIVFAPFVFGVNEPDTSAASGKHEFPSA